MSYPVFTQQEFKNGLARLGEADVRKLLLGGALDGDEARWASEWLAAPTPYVRPAPVQAPANEPHYTRLPLAS